MTLGLLIVGIVAQCIILVLGLMKLSAKWGRIDSRLEHIESEMKTNGGSTLKDKLVKVNTQLDDHIRQHNQQW